MSLTYAVAIRLVPSKAAPGKFNWVNAQGESASVDPDGNLSWKAGADGNFEQFDREGVALVIRPTSDTHPNTAPTIVLLPVGS